MVCLCLGAWKVGVVASGLMFACFIVFAAGRDNPEPPPGLFASLLLGMGSFTLSAALTAGGLFGAYRTGMRIWIGEGVNRARTLLLGMLIVGFFFVVLVPICLGLARSWPTRSSMSFFFFLLFSGVFAGPVVILMVLDRISRRVIADLPSKFGPKVPTVGKWSD